MELLIRRINGLYAYKDLVKQLVTKDIKLKYRRSFLGYFWSILNPLLIMAVMVVVFSQIFRFEIDHYPVYLIIGQTLFNFMSESTGQAIYSILGNASLLKKVYVPKYIFTLSKVTSSLVNLLFSLGAMLIVFIASRIQFSIYMLFIPVILIELYVFCLGLGMFLAQAAVFFRDIQYIYNVFITVWMYLTPIFYPISILPDYVKNVIVNINPLYFYIDQFRTVVLEQQLPMMHSVAGGCIAAIIALILGIWSFLKTQDKFILYI